MSGPAAMMASSALAYDAANVMLMRSESTSADTLVAMLGSCGAQGIQASRSVGGLEDSFRLYRIFDKSEETGDEDAADDCSPHVEKKRRLTVQQIRSLEKNFELDNKLEPERKMQLARELGLQPRQVAVWFQNRRARWKSKQLERDYDVLKSDYDALKSEYDSIVEDKENLHAEIRQLKVKLQIQSKQRKLDGQFLKADLGPRIDMALRSESVGGARDNQEGQMAQNLMLNSKHHEFGASDLINPTVRGSGIHYESPLESKAASSESDSCEVMNADSPHPIDSGLSPCGQLSSPTTDNVGTSPGQFVRDLCGGKQVALAPQPFQPIVVKVDDGVMSSNLLQEECSNYFCAIDESGSLPWWEWP